MWQQLKINDHQYFIQVEITPEFVIAKFSDLVSIWKESFAVPDAVSRFKECNTGVKAPDESILKFIRTLFEEENVEKTLQVNGPDVKLDITKVLGPKMKYYFNFSKQNEETVFREITLPLLLLVNEFKHREDILYKELEAKDVELLEFELEGFKITRRNVITSKFKKDEFNRRMKDDLQERLTSTINLAHHIFLKDLNEFYSLYEKSVLQYSTEQLKQGHILDDKKDDSPNKVIEEKKTSPKRKYSVELNVPIKRFKNSKKHIL